MQVNKKAEIMDDGAMRRAINRISFEIIEKNHGSADLVLAGIKTRGEFLANRISEKIGEVEGTKPLVYTLDISAYRDDKPRNNCSKPEQNNVIEAIETKTVIIVDDVLFTGRTVRAAIEAVSQMGRAKRIQLAALIDRGHREIPIRPDFVGKNLPTSAGEKVKVQMREIDGSDAVLILEGNTI